MVGHGRYGRVRLHKASAFAALRRDKRVARATRSGGQNLPGETVKHTKRHHRENEKRTRNSGARIRKAGVQSPRSKGGDIIKWQAGSWCKFAKRPMKSKKSRLIKPNPTTALGMECGALSPQSAAEDGRAPKQIHGKPRRPSRYAHRGHERVWSAGLRPGALVVRLLIRAGSGDRRSGSWKGCPTLDSIPQFAEVDDVANRIGIRGGDCQLLELSVGTLLAKSGWKKFV
jgi:hypothetical protein